MDRKLIIIMKKSIKKEEVQIKKEDLKDPEIKQMAKDGITVKVVEGNKIDIDIEDLREMVEEKFLGVIKLDEFKNYLNKR